MIDKDEFENYYAKIKSDEEGIGYILSIVLSLLTQISKKKICLRESKFIIKEDSYLIKLFPKENSCCPIFFEMLNQNEIDIQLNQGGEYLYLQPIQNISDGLKLRNAVSDILRNEIIEEVLKIEGSIRKVTYTVYQTIDGKSRPYVYSNVLGQILPWKKKDREKITYQPWIE
ncbi:hypothetical protein [Ekhidna sp.]|uniref:hypothetical protein n=1 Tax=Ekhidna sp. TaxID=2608089 RepID=UPI003299340C